MAVHVRYVVPDLPANPHTAMAGVHKAEVMLESNIDGVEKVENANGKYAFFMESASIQYLVERRCKLSQVTAAVMELTS